MPKFSHGKLCECCLDDYYKCLAKTWGNYMVCNIGAMDNLNHKMMQLRNVGSFLLCYDIVHKSILLTCFSGMC
jgi:hypothetical protein